MGLLIFILLACWCFALPPLLLWMGKVRRLTVLFWAFFGITSIVNGFFMKFLTDLLYGWSDSDDWVPFVGPAIVLLPFAWMIYGLERGTRKPVSAAIIAVFGSLPVTALWLISSALFVHE